jgi:hypothetical protein
MKTRVYKILIGIIAFVCLFLILEVFDSKNQLKNIEILNASISDSLLYQKLKGAGDSLVLNGNIEEAKVYYHGAEKIFKNKHLLLQRLDFVNSLNPNTDSIILLRNSITKLKMELGKLSDLLKEEAKKDSIIKTQKIEFQELNIELNKLKNEIQEERRRSELNKKKIGNIEFFITKDIKVYYAGDLADNKATGYGYGLYSTGGVYEGEWKENKRHGKGKYTWKDGSVYEGDYFIDERQGKGTYHFVSGEKYIGEWKNNKRNGKGVLFAKDGKELVNGLWENDEPLKKLE